MGAPGLFSITLRKMHFPRSDASSRYLFSGHRESFHDLRICLFCLRSVRRGSRFYRAAYSRHRILFLFCGGRPLSTFVLVFRYPRFRIRFSFFWLP